MPLFYYFAYVLVGALLGGFVFATATYLAVVFVTDGFFVFFWPAVALGALSGAIVAIIRLAT